MKILLSLAVLVFNFPLSVSAEGKFFHSYAGLSSSSLAIWAAKDLNLFAKYLLDVDFVRWSGCDAVSHWWKYQSADTDAVSPINAILRGGDAVIVAGVNNKPLFKFVTQKEITEPSQLRKKRIGVASFGGTNEFTVIVSQSGRSALPDVKEIPIVGWVRAGTPALAEENVEGFLPVASGLARGKETFALKVKGDSMIEDGILDGDLVIIRRQDTVENGDIICALIGNEATLKRFYRKGNEVSLRPANKNYDPIIVSKGEFRVLGKATGVIRKL